MIGLEFFALGMLTAIFLGLIVGMFRAWKHIVDLHQTQMDLERNIEVETDEFNHQINALDEKFDIAIEQIDAKTQRNLDELYSYIDSRFDRFDNKMQISIEMLKQQNKLD